MLYINVMISEYSNGMVSVAYNNVRVEVFININNVIS